MTTLAPSLARASTMALPIPLLPPVTMATLPCSVIGSPSFAGMNSLCILHALAVLTHHPDRMNDPCDHPKWMMRPPLRVHTLGRSRLPLTRPEEDVPMSDIA